MVTKPGEVWLADLGLAAKTRPVLIVSRADEDPPRSLVIQVPLTSQNRGSQYEVHLGKLGFLSQESTANVQGMASVPTVRLLRKLGEVRTGQLQEVREAIKFTLDLQSTSE